jgi:hypothetical protein
VPIEKETDEGNDILDRLAGFFAGEGLIGTLVGAGGSGGFGGSFPTSLTSS